MPSMETRQSILIVDDDRELGQMLAEYLGADGWRVEVVHEGRTGLNAALEDTFDAMVLDVMLPGMNGFEVLRALRARSTMPVIMLTARGEETDRIVGLELGADDYLPKPFNPRELSARLRAILRRARPGLEGRLSAGSLTLEHASRQVSLDGESIDLTAAEFAVLEKLMENPGEVVHKELLARHALGRELQPFERSIDTHVSRLRGKLGPMANGEARIQAVRGRGYVLIEDDRA